MGIKDYTGLVVISAIAGAGMVASELTGLTDAIATYSDMQRRGWHEAHKRYPWAVWGDYGDPKNPIYKITDRVDANLTMGLFGLMVTGAGVIAVGDFQEKKRKRENKRFGADLIGKRMSIPHRVQHRR